MTELYVFGALLIACLIVFLFSFRNRYCRACKKAWSYQYFGHRYDKQFRFIITRTKVCRHCGNEVVVKRYEHERSVCK